MKSILQKFSVVVSLIVLVQTSSAQVNIVDQLRMPTMAFSQVVTSTDSISIALEEEMKYYQRWNFFWEGRTSHSNALPGGDYDGPAAMSRSLLDNPLPLCGTALSDQPWAYAGPHHGTSVNNKPYLGILTAVHKSSVSDDVILVGTNTSGIFKTQDGGQNWYNVTDDLRIPALGVNNIIASPDNSDILWATTGATSNGYGGYSLGLIYSYDFGDSWESKEMPGVSFSNYSTDRVVEFLKYHPTNSNIIVAGGFRHIWISQDGGLTFQVSYVLPEVYVTEPDDVDQYYITDIEFAGVDNSTILASTAGGLNLGFIYKSNDMGATWTDVTPAGAPFQAFALERDPFEPNQVFAASAWKQGLTTVNKLFSTLDSGNSWEFKTDFPGDLTYFMHDFRVSKVFPNLFYLGAVNLNILRFGNGWTVTLAHDNLHDDIRDIFVWETGTGSESVLLATDGGLSFRTLLGSNPLLLWEQPSGWLNKNGLGLHITQVYGSGRWQNSKRTIYGAQDVGTWLWEIDDQFPVQKVGGDGAYTSINHKHTKIGMGGRNNTLSTVLSNRITYDQGANFSTSVIPSSQIGKLTTRHYFSLTNPRELYLTVQSLYRRSFNQDLTDVSDWIQLGLPDQGPTISAFAELRGTMLVARNNPYYAGIANSVEIENSPGLQGRVLRSVNNGETFEDISESIKVAVNGNDFFPYTDFALSCIKADPFRDGHFIAGLNGYTRPQDPPVRVIETFDAGTTWTDISAGLPPLPIVDLVIEYGSEVYWAATDVGVYRFNRVSSSWECFNYGLPPVIVTGINIDYCTEDMLISTYGRGFWINEMPEIDAPMHISQDLEIGSEEYYSIANWLILDEGVTVTIKGELNFKEGYGIEVSPGAKLIVDGGKLAGLCGSFWRGVQVGGNPSAAQVSSLQGVVELKNGAIIEHAEMGILAGQPPLSEGKKTYLKGGGIVKCIGSELRNNVVDIRFAPYLFAPSASYVFDSQLITDEVYSDE
ncbi:MAG: WD40/YVTN/BNR-like repeat-containing protein, partial [Flavobacteriales bacterium]